MLIMINARYSSVMEKWQAAYLPLFSMVPSPKEFYIYTLGTALSLSRDKYKDTTINASHFYVNLEHHVLLFPLVPQDFQVFLEASMDSGDMHFKESMSLHSTEYWGNWSLFVF